MYFTEKDIQTLPEQMPLGKKAKNLFSLYKLANSLFEIPPFAAISSDVIQNYNQRHFIQSTTTPDYIHFLSGPLEIQKIYIDFVHENQINLQKAFFETLSWRPALIRTSICLDEIQNASFAGVNTTTKSKEKDVNSYLKTVVPCALAGLYKPYTNWYLKRRGLENKGRECILMFSKFVSNPNCGIAHMTNNQVDIHLGRTDETQKDYFQLNLSQPTENKAQQFQKLFNALKFIRTHTKQPHVEVEFLFEDNNPDKLLLQQMREVANNQDLSITSDQLPSFINHKKIYNAIDTPNTIEHLTHLIDTIKDKEQSVFVINHQATDLETSYLDVTSLILAFYDRYPQTPMQIIAVYDGIRPSTHLMTALREDSFYQFKMMPKEEMSRYLNNHKEQVIQIPSLLSKSSKPPLTQLIHIKEKKTTQN